MFAEILTELMEETKKRKKTIIIFTQPDVKCKGLPACFCRHRSGSKRLDMPCQTASGLKKWFTPFIDFLPNEDR